MEDPRNNPGLIAPPNQNGAGAPNPPGAAPPPLPPGVNLGLGNPRIQPFEPVLRGPGQNPPVAILPANPGVYPPGIPAQPDRQPQGPTLEELQAANADLQGQLEGANQIISQLMAPPFILAAVIRKIPPQVDPEAPVVQRALQVGDRVRLRPESEFYGDQGGLLGELTGFNDRGWAQVLWSNGIQNVYRAGNPQVDNGFSDLELVPQGEGLGTVVILLEDAKTLEVAEPDGVAIQPGDIVRVNVQTKAIVDICPHEYNGVICPVKEVMDAEKAKVDYGGAERTVYRGRFIEPQLAEGEEAPAQPMLRKGDHVVIFGENLIIRNLGRNQNNFRYAGEGGVAWEAIGGQDEAKQAIIEAIEHPMQYPDLFQFYGRRPDKGFLLYGPPGCGKTLIGKALARRLRELHGGEETETSFMVVKGPEVLEKWVGNSEANIRSIFQQARDHYERFGYPAVIFWDEAESILSKRGTGVSSDMDKTLVTTFLTEMDGVEENHCIVILSTNRPDVLDPAVIREGRVGTKIYVGRPTAETAGEIFKIYLEQTRLRNGFELPAAVELCVEELFSPARTLYVVKRKSEQEPRSFTLGHLSSGAMIAEIIQQATSLAIREDRNQQEVRPRGIRPQHLRDAIEKIYQQNLKLEHKEALEEYVHDFKDDVQGITRFQTAQP